MPLSKQALQQASLSTGNLVFSQCLDHGLPMLIEDPLWEEDVELDNKVTLWLVVQWLQLCGCVHHNVSSLGQGHAFALHSQFCLWSHDRLWSDKDLTVVQGVDGDWLHLDCLGKRDGRGDNKVITSPLVAWLADLGKLDDQVRCVGTKGLMAKALVDKGSLLTETWLDFKLE